MTAIPTDARDWVYRALHTLEREALRSADTHLLRLDFPGFPDIAFYFKDEAAHPSGSLKHRLARSLYLYALCNGRLREGQGVVDASSGSTAISEAWFARLLGLHFTAVMPASTAPGKIRELRALDATCDLVDDPAQVSTRIAAHVDAGACCLDQFGLAERATDWRGNNNIAESIIAQLAREAHPQPTWIVCGAGTGGTSATIGRYLRYRRLPTRLCVAEPTGGAFAEGWRRSDRAACASQSTWIEGIGRRRVEPCFLFEVVDAVEEVDDAASIAGAWLLRDRIGYRYGGSSGTNLVACLRLAARMRARGQGGAIVTLLCDRGERYDDTVFASDWLARHAIDIAPWQSRLQSCIDGGVWAEPVTGCGDRRAIMEYHVRFGHSLAAPDAIEDAIRSVDMAATIAIDAADGYLRVATWIVAADLLQALARAGEPVSEAQVVEQPSVCCGDCSG